MTTSPMTTHRSRVEAALAHREPDRPPYDQASRSSAIEIEAYDALKGRLGLHTPSSCFLRSHAELELPVVERLGIDAQFLRSVPASSWTREGKDQVFVDSWGVPWRRKEGASYFELDSCPLANLDPKAALELEWGPLVSDEMIEDLKRQAALWRSRGDWALFCDQVGAGVFERAWYLRGFERVLMDLMLEKDWTLRFFEKILERQLEAYGRIFDALGDSIMGILVTDDLATQSSLLMSPECYREMLKPLHARLIDFARSRGQRVILHSCGAVRPLIPDLIDAGVEILHPIQRSAAGMDPGPIKREFGRDLTLWGGGCDTAFLQSATPAEVRAAVLRDLDELAPGGGFVYTTTHCIQPGTPPDNILAMADALREWRGESREGGIHG
jgi:Uroporphyrinogen-III decarboxylase